VHNARAGLRLRGSTSATPAPGPPSRSLPRSWGRASVGDGEHDQDDEEPAPVGSSTSAAGERDAGDRAAYQRPAPVVSVLVRFVVRSFSTNSRPASGRPPAALGRLHAAATREA